MNRPVSSVGMGVGRRSGGLCTPGCGRVGVAGASAGEAREAWGDGATAGATEAESMGAARGEGEGAVAAGAGAGVRAVGQGRRVRVQSRISTTFLTDVTYRYGWS